MPANLDTRENGEAAIFVVGEPAWHGEGVVFPEPPTLAEAIAASGLDYTVTKVPVGIMHNADSGMQFVAVPDQYATIRTDRAGQPNAALGVVGERYHVMQNAAAWDFFAGPVERGDVTLESAGVLAGGRTAWILARLPEVVRVGADIHEAYLLLTNSFDGSRPVQVGFNPVRVVCQNTHNIAMKQWGQNLRIRHTEGMEDKLKEAERVLVYSRSFFEAYAEVGNRLAETAMSTDQRASYFKTLFPDHPESEKGRTSLRPSRTREVLERLHEEGPGAEPVRGTVWGAYNAVSRYADFGLPLRSTTSRLNNVWFGTGAALKQRAFDVAVAHVPALAASV